MAHLVKERLGLILLVAVGVAAAMAVAVTPAIADDMAFKGVPYHLVSRGWYQDDLATKVPCTDLEDAADWTTKVVEYWNSGTWTTEYTFVDADFTCDQAGEVDVILPSPSNASTPSPTKHRIRLVNAHVTDTDINSRTYYFDVYDTTVTSGTSTAALPETELIRRAYQALAGKQVLDPSNKEKVIYDSDGSSPLIKHETQDSTGTATSNPANVYRMVPKN